MLITMPEMGIGPKELGIDMAALARVAADVQLGEQYYRDMVPALEVVQQQITPAIEIVRQQLATVSAAVIFGDLSATAAVLRPWLAPVAVEVVEQPSRITVVRRRGRPAFTLESRLRLVAPYVRANPCITQEELAGLLGADDPTEAVDERTVRRWHSNDRWRLSWSEFKARAIGISVRFLPCTHCGQPVSLEAADKERRNAAEGSIRRGHAGETRRSLGA